MHKFYTDDASLPRSGQCFCLVEANLPCFTTHQKHYGDLDSDVSLCNFCTCFLFLGQTSDGIAECPMFSQAGCGMGNLLEH